MNQLKLFFLIFWGIRSRESFVLKISLNIAINRGGVYRKNIFIFSLN
nr:MAG TPA: hypothetical protein [Caudoviricetes sp.]